MYVCRKNHIKTREREIKKKESKTFNYTLHVQEKLVYTPIFVGENDFACKSQLSCDSLWEKIYRHAEVVKYLLCFRMYTYTFRCELRIQKF